MRKINNFENVQEAGSFKRLPAGGYVCAIYNATDVPEKEYLKIEFDIVKGDEKGYFKKLYDADTRKEKKWPNSGTSYRSYKENALPMFKGFITSIEKSNKNFKWDWDESKLKKKYFGAVIADEEYQNQKGAVRIRNYIAQIHSIDAIEAGEFEVPALKKLENIKQTQTNNEVINPFADTEQPKQNVPDTPLIDDDDEDDPFR